MPTVRDKIVKTYFYRITNLINGNDYVGITTNLVKRWRDHKRDSRLEPSDKESLIAKAMRKHGIENFHFELVTICKTWNNGCYVEQTYRKFGGGKYNRTMGGEGVLGHKHSDESKAKMRAAKLGKKREITPEHRAKLVANGNARKGIPKTDVHKANMSKARTGYLLGPRPQEVKDKISASNTGKVKSPEFCAKVTANKIAEHAKVKELTGMTRTAARWAKVKELGLKNLKALAEYEANQCNPQDNQVNKV